MLVRGNCCIWAYVLSIHLCYPPPRPISVRLIHFIILCSTNLESLKLISMTNYLDILNYELHSISRVLGWMRSLLISNTMRRLLDWSRSLSKQSQRHSVVTWLVQIWFVIAHMKMSKSMYPFSLHISLWLDLFRFWYVMWPRDACSWSFQQTTWYTDYILKKLHGTNYNLHHGAWK